MSAISAIQMTCSRCGARYLAGMVGSRPWPPHVCPELLKAQREAEQNLAASLAEQGTLTGVMR